MHKQLHKIAKEVNEPIAVVGMGCWYPGANNLRQLWENILARRQEFRELPKKRLPISEYYDPDPTTPDKTYGKRAAVIDGFEFDSIGKRIPKIAFESTDIVHWLALEVAIKALEDAGYARDSVPTERSGVVLGNTLTGENTRSNTMRLRWPYIRRTLYAAAQAKGFSSQLITELVETLEEYYKSVFPPITEDTLAGNLSNTIAGRICNFFDFHGGGYTVDGACSSSLIAVTTAARSLARGELDLALAGGVDVSLDPFELVGFAKAGALTNQDMTVYDKRANGFIPGEGCGFVVLKRLEDARADGNYVYAILRGWGISSDGKGGITAPSKKGQMMALSRAYAGSGYRLHDVAFVEGHGTGTSVGDRTELEAIALAMNSDGEVAPRSCGITSFKSIVGHTKAAAGIGGFIKAVMAVNRRILPPTANCKEPNAVFETSGSDLYPILQGEVRSKTETLRAGVSAMGFGGINCHVTIESADAPSGNLEPLTEERALLVSNQETELFVFGAASIPDLLQRTLAVMHIAEGMSVGELVDLAAHLVSELEIRSPVRAAVIAGTPEKLIQNLQEIERILREMPPAKGEAIAGPQKDIWLSNSIDQSRVGFLFPGQGSQHLNMARLLVERYGWARELVEQANQWLIENNSEAISQLIFRPLDRAVNAQHIQEWSMALTQTKIAQPAICLASLLWINQLNRLGVKPVAVGGHSLGELTAFHVAGAFDQKTLLCLAAVRGQAMFVSDKNAGAMASLACSQETAESLLQQVDGYVVVANINSPKQIVISGERASVQQAIKLATANGIQTHQLSVSNAFHSQMVAPAADHIRQYSMLPELLEKLNLQLVSSLDGQEVMPGRNLREHFACQVLAQVDFVSLVKTLAQNCDLLVEVGSGRVLSNLANDIITGQQSPMCFPIESKPGLDQDLNTVLASLFVHGHEIKWEALYKDRLVRPFVCALERVFIDNSCEKPFQVSTQPTSNKFAVSGDWFESMLNNAANLSPQVMSDYLSQRGKFIAEVIRADLQTLPFSAPVNGTKTQEAQIPGSSIPETQSRETVLPSTEDFLLDLVSERTGYPKESITSDARLLDDLNLDSIKASELIAVAAKEYGVAGKIDPSTLANTTLKQVAEVIYNTTLHGDEKSALDTVTDIPSNVTKTLTRQGQKSWVRNFIIQYVPEKVPTIPLDQYEDDWKIANALIICDSNEKGMAEALRNALHKRGTCVEITSFTNAHEQSLTKSEFSHFIAILPHLANSKQIPRLQTMVGRLYSISTPPASPTMRKNKTVAYIQFGGGYFGTQPPLVNIEQCCTQAFAASLHLERPDLKVRAIDLSPSVDPNLLAERVVDELSSSDAYLAVAYDSNMTRRVPKPKIQHKEASQKRNIAWSTNDVILVTGGGKGITSECAFAFAKSTGVRMALVGSSPYDKENHQHTSTEIAHTLNSFSSEGLICNYYQCDISNANAVVNLLQQVRQELGEITGVIHGAGLNRPGRLEKTSTEMAETEIAPKVVGAMNLCQAMHDRPPKLFVGFSSVISVIGMAGNAWYAFANEALDLILRRFEAENPETSVLSIAFTVWQQIGMGARMGNIQTLAEMGIDAISKDEGVRRFLYLMDNDLGEPQVIVTSRLGLDTWRPELYSMPAASNFLQKLCYVEPDVEVISRTHLNLEQDSYVQDHLYKGTYLFPTVFGLEAMAQAVAYATGVQNFSALRIEDVRLERPIVVAPDQGVEIEIRVEVLEHNHDSIQRVQAQISTEQTGFAIPHFSAIFVLGTENVVPIEHIEIPKTPLNIQPQQDLYGWLLFQGFRFQRLQKIYNLDSQKCVFRAEVESQPFLLGDPFFRDSLLHVVQLLVPQDICLPIHIECIEFFPTNSHDSSSHIGVAMLQGQSDQHYLTNVFAINNDGQMVERLSGYNLQRLEHYDENPTAEMLAEPDYWDEEILRRELNIRTHSLRMMTPVISLVYLPGLHTLSVTERHQRELPILHKTVGQLIDNDAFANPIEIEWLDSGKPLVKKLVDKKADVSLSHDEQICLCVAGWGAQGCDIAPVIQRSLEDWIALLSQYREPLIQKLLDAKDSVDLAGTRIWIALEALRKATNSQDVNLVIDQQQGDSILFRGTTSSSNKMYVLTFGLRLTRGADRLVAIVVEPIESTQSSITTVSSNGDEQSVNYTRDCGEKTEVLQSFGYDSSIYGINSIVEADKKVLVLRWPISLRDTTSLSGSVYFSNYFSWMGKVSQIAMQPIGKLMTQQLATGQWGLVTNYAQTRILGQAKPHDVLEVYCWIERLSNSILNSYYDWRKVLPQGTRERLAWTEHRGTWVKRLEHGGVSIHPFPDYLQNFINEVSSPGTTNIPQSLPEPLANVTLGRELYRTSAGPTQGILLRKQTFETTLQDTDLIGNIYFANYYALQGRIVDRFFYDLIPEYYHNRGKQGELWCLRSSCQHLREAKPFDQIDVVMSLHTLYECGLSLSFEYFRTTNGDKQKIAIGEQDVVWLTRNDKENLISTSLPEIVQKVLLRSVDVMRF